MAYRAKYTFTVPGRPRPAARMTQKSKWTDRARRSLNYQESVAWEAKAAKIPTITGNVILTCRFCLKGRGTGDLSNYIKGVEDGLQYGGILPNDRQVIGYGEGTGIVLGYREEKAEITIEEVNET